MTWQIGDFLKWPLFDDWGRLPLARGKRLYTAKSAEMKGYQDDLARDKQGGNAPIQIVAQ